MEELLQFLDSAKTFYFATTEGDQPRVRPFGFYMHYNGVLYFGVGSQKAAYRELQANPAVELCAFHGGKFLRLRGRAVFVQSEDVYNHQFEVLPFLSKSYNEETGDRHLPFYLADMSAVLFNMNGETRKLL